MNGSMCRRGGPRGLRRVVLVLLVASTSGCASAQAHDEAATPSTPSTTAPTPAEPATTEHATTSTEPAATTTTTPATTTTEPATTTTTPATTTTEPATTTSAPATTTTDATGSSREPVSFDHLADVFRFVAPQNAAMSISVLRDHQPVFSQAWGIGVKQQPVTPDSPLVLASVSKLITSLTVARLVELGVVDLDAAVPWAAMNIVHDPSWDNVTIRELLDHTSGMPIARNTWINHPGSCAVPLTEAMALPPRSHRGTWVYSNGNYCALGLLIEAVTASPLDAAARALVFDPIGITGPHLTTTGLLDGDGPYAEGVARLERLGGAGGWLASSADLAAMLDSVTPDDRATLSYPAIMLDQYGWGHTGTIDGAKACAWVMEQGRTVVVAIVTGDEPATGGQVCDAVVQAIALDLGIWADRPLRSPD